MSDSGTPADGQLWAAPGSTRAAGGAAGVPLAPPSGPTRDGAAPVEEILRPRRAWTPPPKRGLVPLRPIPLGVVLGAPFRLQRRTPRTTLAPALVLSLVTTSIVLLAQWALTVGPQAALDASYYQDFVRAQNLLGVAGAVGWWVPLTLAFPATALLAGLVVVPTARALLAERVSFRGVRWRLRGRLGALILWTVIVLLAATGTLAAAAVLPVVVAAGSPAGLGFAFLIAFLEVVALAVGAGYVVARLGFTSAAISLEGHGLGAAIRRSWALTGGAGWRLYLSQALVWIVVGLATALLVLPVGWALDIAAGLIFPNGPTSTEAEWYGAGRTVVLSVVTAMTGAFGLVVQTVCGALFYLDSRMRVEGLDLTLARYVDERQRGFAVADPFPGGGSA
ncbi:hypothetical protein [Pseudolysinimonas sp.]|uniref:hypothetical protein n=1 Tax=Pseudolysinimonas sp. TaxID=2680009 RepID=UPI003783177A